MKFLLSLYFFLYCTNSYAYLDPGTGSIILQIIAGALAGAFATVNLWWSKIKNVFKKYFKKKIK